MRLKGLKQDFCVYLFATPISHAVLNLCNIHGLTDVCIYIFVKQISCTKFAKISKFTDYTEICSDLDIHR